MRYGLKREGLYGYRVDGPKRSVTIRRHGSLYIIGDTARPIVPGFFCHKFKRLRDAAAYAKAWSGCRPVKSGTSRRASPENLAFLVGP